MNLRRQLGREDGVAVAVALGAMFLVTLIATAVLSDSISLSDTTERDRSSKRAFAAADAGLDAATFRINRLAPSNALCVTDVVVLPVPGIGCPEHTETVAGDARYTYRVTPILNVNDQCAGLPVQTSTDGLTLIQRCVTAVGTADDRTRRVQARVAAFQGNPIFPLPGIIGLESIDLKNTAYINGWLGSNGLIAMKNSSSVSGQLALGPSAPDPSVGGSTTGPIHRRTNAEGGWVLAPVEIGDSVTVNDNARIARGLTSPPLAPYDASSGASYTAATRSLVLGSNAQVTLGGGTYNFCSVSLGNNSQILIAPRPAGQPQGVRIFIDSPYRPGSDCPAGSGTLTMGQRAGFGSPPNGDPRNLQIYVYGWSPGENPVANTIEFNNNGLIAAFYAPQSAVVFNNDALLRGALAARKVEAKNDLTFDWMDNMGEIRVRTLTLFYRTAWKECRSGTVSAPC